MTHDELIERLARFLARLEQPKFAEVQFECFADSYREKATRISLDLGLPALLAEVERLRGGSDVVAAALAYVNAPDGTDAVEQYWWELKNAVGNYERSTGGDGADG